MFTQLKALSVLQKELDQLLPSMGPRELTIAERLPHGRIRYRGHELIDCTSWDVLDLACHTGVRRALQRAAEGELSVGSARAVSGSRSVHAALEQRLAAFTGNESALLFSSRNQALLSLVTALTGERDQILVDERSQSPVLDAAVLTGAQVVAVDMRDRAKLVSDMARLRPARLRVLFVEAMSPFDGELADLTAICEVAEAHDAVVVVDESFSLGLVGVRGAGGSEVYGVASRVFCQVGDLSRGAGLLGAFVAGRAALMGYLLARSRTFAHEVALPSPLCSALLVALGEVELSVGPRERLHRAAGEVTAWYYSGNSNSPSSPRSPLISLRADRLKEAQQLAQALFERGILAEVLPSPQPRDGGGAVRLLLSKAHRSTELKQIATALAELTPKVKGS